MQGREEGGQFISLWCLKYYWTLDSTSVCVPPSSDLRPGRCCVSKYVQNDKHVFIRRRVVEKWRMRAKYKASSLVQKVQFSQECGVVCNSVTCYMLNLIDVQNHN